MGTTAREPEVKPRSGRGTVYDLSLVIHEGMLVYPGDPAPRTHRLAAIDDGAPLTASSVELSCHTGTHVDAPSHFVAGGRTLSDYPVEAFCGPAVVVDLEGDRNVTAASLRARAVPAERHLLLRTRNSARLRSPAYDRDHAYVEPEAARLLMSLRPLSIGFDYFSVDSSAGSDLTVHRLFAAEGLLVYVCLDLAAIPAGDDYQFFGLPLRLDGAEACPVRALATRRRAARGGRAV